MSSPWTPPRLAAQGGLHQALAFADNLAQAVDHRMREANGLAHWMDSVRRSAGLPGGADYSCGLTQPLPIANWRRLRAAITRGRRMAPRADIMPGQLWLETLANLLGLDEIECDLLALTLYYRVDQNVEQLVDEVSSARGGIRELCCDYGLIASLLGTVSGAIEDRLRRGARLRASGLIGLDHHGHLCIFSPLATLVRTFTAPGNDPFTQLLGETVAATLPWDAFAHLSREAEVSAALLTAALAGRERGVHILLYGPPGTGKTTFAATLAHRVGATLRPVTEQDDRGMEPDRGERLHGLQLAQRLAAPGTVLLFDEAEDVFLHRGSDKGAATSRVFMHRLLEQSPVPVIWTANDIANIGPAALRRMTMCLELKIPGIAVRTRLWRSMAEAEGVQLDDAEAAVLAHLVPAAPAVAYTALRATRLAGGDASTAQLIVEGIARAVGGGRSPVPPAPRSDHYDPALVHADCDLFALTEQLSHPGRPRAVSLLLSGPPGTGKSAFARYLAGRMGLEVLQKRASDLLGPVVGQTEANIAAAFAEAVETGAFLIFDEADSLLGDRARALRSWEVSEVNEMLTWMEQHPLPFACTTNLPDRLDPACLRRFLIKLRLDWLTQAQARQAFCSFFAAEAPPGLNTLGTLTPADFALVKRRTAFMQVDHDPVTLLEWLAAECEGRNAPQLPVGFQVA